ncbi:MAG: MFS transporter, partial [Bacillota bacterium]|nr:MFS transporter [Bacillota bacterium]
LMIVFTFAVGYPSDAFLILRAGDAGFGTASMLLLYFIYYVSGSLLSYPLGKLSDKIGRRKLVVPAYVLFGLVYLGFAFADQKWMFYPLFIVYGLFTAMVNGAEKAFLSEYAPKNVRGTVLGLYGTAQGIGYLFASIIAGLLWDRLGSYAPFLLGALLGVLSAAASLIVMALKPKPAAQS